MKRNLVILAFICSLVGVASSQTVNHALSLPLGSSAVFGQTVRLDNLATGTIQFWFKVAQWTEGAPICSRGSELLRFAVELGAEKQLIVRSGNATIELADDAFIAASWVQFSLSFGNGEVKVYVNGQLKNTLAASLFIPSSNESFTMGGNGFVGQIDEFRIWDVPIVDPFYLMWRNTVNKWHPQWENLVVYYKFDQDRSANIVDYKRNYNGLFVSGASRVEVVDNSLFKYRISAGYTNINRWGDCQIDRDRYLFTNDLIILGAEPNSQGVVSMPFPYNKGVVTNGEYLSSFEGRTGVLSVNGTGSSMAVGTKAFNPRSAYSFATWLYLDSWTEGAFIFKKEVDGSKGFSIRLGSYEDRKRVWIRVNGVEYSIRNRFDVGQWVHIGVSTNSNSLNDVYSVVINGEAVTCSNKNQNETNLSFDVSGLEETVAYIGVDIHGKFDETVLYSTSTSVEVFAALKESGPIFPSETTKIEFISLQNYDSYWKYDRADEIGYDYFSYRYFTQLMRDNYIGYRGFKMRVGIGSWTNWQSSISNAQFRTRMATSIGEMAADPLFDGVDIDLEWCYSDQTCWNNYSALVNEMRNYIPKEKSLTVTPHYVSYAFPTSGMDKVDYFLFQIYGPSKDVFSWNTYQDGYDRFKKHGYDNSKILLSYATTTSRGYNPNGSEMTNPPAPVGVRANGPGGKPLLDPSFYTPDMNDLLDGSGLRRYITGVNQTIQRNEFVQENDLGGIFYWDLGNDVPAVHTYSLLKHANYSLASNVDTLITHVDPPVNVNLPMSGNKEPSLMVVYEKETQTLRILNGETLAIDSYTIYSSGGQQVVDKKLALTPITLSYLSSGTYLVKANSIYGEVYFSKFLK